MVAAWPEPVSTLVDEEAESRMRDFQELVTAVRSLRKEYGVAEGEDVEIVLVTERGAFRETVASEGRALQRLARVGAVGWERRPDVVGAHGVLANGAELFLPLEGVIDLARERERLRQEIGRLDGQLRQGEARLANESFTARAPAEVVQRERDKAAALAEQLGKLREKLTLLGGGE